MSDGLVQQSMVLVISLNHKQLKISTILLSAFSAFVRAVFFPHHNSTVVSREPPLLLSFIAWFDGLVQI